MANLPLAGLKILVTRPRDQALQLAQGISQAGGIPVLFPLLDIAPVQDTRILQEQIARLPQFNLAIFISPNAVQYGMAAIHTAGGLPPEIEIATVGSGSAKALRELGIADVMVPAERYDSEGLLALPQLQQLAGWRVMIFRGEGGRELLGDVLRARGAKVEYAACYHRTLPQQDARTLLDVQAITVTSSEAQTHLSQMLQEADLTGEERSRILGVTPLFVLHARIAELARKLGWLDVRVTGGGDDGLLGGLLAWSGKRESGCEVLGRDNLPGVTL